MTAATRIVFFIFLVFVAIWAGAAVAQTLSDTDGDSVAEAGGPATCWEIYSECATAAFGDESWRSGCYSDFTACLGSQNLNVCPPSGQPAACTAFESQCAEFATGNDEAQKQCAADADVCRYAHGC